MNRARQVIAAALAAVALVVTAAPSAPAPDTSGWSWQPMYFSGLASPSVSVANDQVTALKVVGDDLYVGGSFTNFAGTLNRNRIARWNSDDGLWHDVGPVGAITSGSVLSIEVSGDILYIGGDFTIVDSAAETHHNFAYLDMSTNEWHGISGASSGDLVSNGEVRTIFADEYTASLYVGGTFTNGNDNDNADYLMIGTFSACGGGVVSACVAEVSHASVCGGVSVSCAIALPNRWDPVGDDGAGGPALTAFVSSVASDPAGGVLISGDFGAAGGVVGANSLAHLVYTDHFVWTPQSTPAVTMYPIALFNSTPYVGGWEDVYRRNADQTWSPICASGLHAPGGSWTSVTPVSSTLVITGNPDGLFACNPQTGGSLNFFTGSFVTAIAKFHDDLIVAGGTDLGDLGSVADYIAIVRGVNFTDLPSTNSDARHETDSIILLITLAALTALAGTQLLRRA